MRKVIRPEITEPSEMLVHELEHAIGKTTKEINRLNRYLTDLKSEHSERQKPFLNPVVSDHALLRYLERYHNIDIDGLREQIITDAVKLGVKLGAKEIKSDKFNVVLKGNMIVTIVPKG